MPATSNRLARTLEKLNRLPGAMGRKARTLLVGQVIPFVKTGECQIDAMTPQEVVVSVKNHRGVRNHIKGVHAAAMALVAETATGLVVGMNVSDQSLPLLKTMKVDYVARCRGGLRATATLTASDQTRLAHEPKGEVLVQLQVRDEEGGEPIVGQFTWAWVPKKRDA
jgi:acyl-coenzyme A thioesterase PaaI-like protein